MPGQNPLADRGIKKESLNHPWMDLRLLENESFIMQLPGQRTRQAVDQLFREYHMEPNIKLQTSNITAEAALVSKGYGCCFVTESHLRHIRPLDNVSFFSVGSPARSWILWPHSVGAATFPIMPGNISRS